MTEDSKPKRNKSFCSNCHDRNFLVECGCGICHEIVFLRDKWSRIVKYKNGHCNRGRKLKNVKKGPDNHNWKGGRKIVGGYWYIWMPYYFSSKKNGYVLEHVYFYQEYHKCCMLKWGVVHHIDENKENNMPWNLQGMTRGQHITLHKTGVISYQKDMDNRFCKYCNGKTYVTKDGYEQWNGDEISGFICKNCYDKIRRGTMMVIGN